MGYFANRRIRNQLQEQRLRAELRLAHQVNEALDLTAAFVDPREALRDPETGEIWVGLGAVGGPGALILADTEQGLAQIRNTTRLLATTNEYAINGHENRISYIVGSGFAYEVAAFAKDDELTPEEHGEAQGVIDDFIAANKWHRRQQEIVRRKDRDGECFLRFFQDEAGGVIVRFVEPGEVSTPDNVTLPNASFGILTAPDDVETVEGYYIQGQLIPADEVQHRKSNVDANVKRGLPLFFPVVPNLNRADKLLRNMSVVASIQAAIAMIRKQTGGSAAVEQFVDSTADVTTTNQTTGTTFRHRGYNPGTIIDAPAGTDYVFPASGIDAGRLVIVLQAELRGIASRLVMPEFMLTSDASNANYASTLVAEGPVVKIFNRLQWELIEEDLEVMDRVLDAAVAAGTLSQELRDRVKVNVIPPRLETRERLKDVQADTMLVTTGAMSIKTLQLRNDLDPDVENEEIAKDRENADPMGGLAFGAGSEEDGDEGEEEDT